MRAQDVQEQNGSAQGVAGQVGGSEGPAQLAGFLFPSRNLNSTEERRRQHKTFTAENPEPTWTWAGPRAKQGESHGAGACGTRASPAGLSSRPARWTPRSFQNTHARSSGRAKPRRDARVGPGLGPASGPCCKASVPPDTAPNGHARPRGDRQELPRGDAVPGPTSHLQDALAAGGRGRPRRGNPHPHPCYPSAPPGTDLQVFNFSHGTLISGFRTHHI